jgi:hypothetical protein
MMAVRSVRQRIAPPSRLRRNRRSIQIRQPADHRLFIVFGAAFWLMALAWTRLALVNPDDEARPLIYMIR